MDPNPSFKRSVSIAVSHIPAVPTADVDYVVCRLFSHLGRATIEETNEVPEIAVTERHESRAGAAFGVRVSGFGFERGSTAVGSVNACGAAIVRCVGISELHFFVKLGASPYPGNRLTVHVVERV